MQNTVFKDLKVVELAGVLAGPSVGYFFAELGAEVIKIENPKTQGDVTRHWKLRSEDPSTSDSAYFWSVNAFKKSLFLDLNLKNDLDRFYHLLTTADLCITNFNKGDDVKLKVDFATLSRLNPKLICANINSFGENSERSAYDLILQAESGFMSMNGSKPGEVLKMPVALIDLLAGHQLKEAILIALLQRFQTGKGGQLSVSLFHSAVASLANQATNWLIAGQVPQALGSLHPNIAPYGELFETKDHHIITFAIGNNKHFNQLCDMLHYPSLAGDKKFSTNHARVLNRKELYSILFDYVRSFNFDQLLSECSQREIPVGKIRNLKEVFDLPEAKTMLKRFETEGGTKTVVSSIAFRFHE